MADFSPQVPPVVPVTNIRYALPSLCHSDEAGSQAASVLDAHTFSNVYENDK